MTEFQIQFTIGKSPEIVMTLFLKAIKIIFFKLLPLLIG